MKYFSILVPSENASWKQEAEVAVKSENML